MSLGFRAKTASFGGTGLTDLTNLSVRQGGASYDLIGDASSNVLDVFVDSIATDITVSSNDCTLMGAASNEVGDSGSLIIVFEKRATGRAAAGSGDKTLTITAALISKDFNAGSNGIGAGTFTFRAAGQATWS